MACTPLSTIKTFASTRETSNEIAQAIFEIAQEGDEARMWESPSLDEVDFVVARAWELAEDEIDELHWGNEKHRREAFKARQTIRNTVERYGFDVVLAAVAEHYSTFSNAITDGGNISIGSFGQPNQGLTDDQLIDFAMFLRRTVSRTTLEDADEIDFELHTGDNGMPYVLITVVQLDDDDFHHRKAYRVTETHFLSVVEDALATLKRTSHGNDLA